MKKFNALFLAATLLAAPVVATVAPVSEISVEAASVKSFLDVSKNNVYYDIINEMTKQGIIKGYEDGTFKPEQALSRKHAAELIYRLDKLKKPATSKGLPKDLTAKHPNYEAIMMLYNHNLLTLDSKGNINPNAELSRGEMAKILATTFELKGSKHPLKDVSSSISSYVAALYANGVTTGFEDKTFKEKQSLTRAHYAVFMYRAMNLEQKDSNSSTNNGSTGSSNDQTTEQTYDIVGSLKMTHLKRVGDIKLPKDETDKKELTAKLASEYSKIFNEKRLNSNGGFVTVVRVHELETRIKNNAKTLQISEKQFVEKINEAYTTGKIVTDDGGSSVPFAIYFDYTNGLLNIGIKVPNN